MPEWHLVHSRLVWAPVNAQPVALWLNVDGCQADVEWHVAQLELKADVWSAGRA